MLLLNRGINKKSSFNTSLTFQFLVFLTQLALSGAIHILNKIALRIVRQLEIKYIVFDSRSLFVVTIHYKCLEINTFFTRNFLENFYLHTARKVKKKYPLPLGQNWFCDILDAWYLLQTWFLLSYSSGRKKQRKYGRRPHIYILSSDATFYQPSTNEKKKKRRENPYEYYINVYVYVYPRCACSTCVETKEKRGREYRVCPGGTEPGGRPGFFKWKIINGPPHHVVFVSFFYFILFFHA